jgi:hypothetical protein
MDNKQIKDGLGNLFTVRMRDYSTDGTIQRPMHLVSQLPLEYGTGGSYSHCAKSGILPNSPALNAAPIYSFQWPGIPPATLYVLLRRVRLSAWATGVFAAGISSFDMFAARSFTAQDTGGISANLAAYNNQLRTTMAASRAHIMYASTLPLVPGTRTLDAAPLDSQTFATPTTAPAPFTSQRMTLFERLQGEHPLFLDEFEGFVISVTMAAGGPWQFAITTEWDELQVF